MLNLFFENMKGGPILGIRRGLIKPWGRPGMRLYPLSFCFVAGGKTGVLLIITAALLLGFKGV